MITRKDFWFHDVDVEVRKKAKILKIWFSMSDEEFAKILWISRVSLTKRLTGVTTFKSDEAIYIFNCFDNEFRK